MRKMRGIKSPIKMILRVLSLALLLNSALAETCQVPWNGGRCAFVKYRIRVGFTHDQAKRYCARSGGKLAVIPSKEAYDEISSFIRASIPKSVDRVEMWIGLEIDPSIGIVTEPFESAYTRWDPVEGLAVGTAYLQWTSVYVSVSTNGESEDHGMVNFRPNAKLDGVICEISS